MLAAWCRVPESTAQRWWSGAEQPASEHLPRLWSLAETVLQRGRTLLKAQRDPEARMRLGLAVQLVEQALAERSDHD